MSERAIGLIRVLLSFFAGSAALGGMILAAEDENGTLSLIVPDKDVNSGANLG